MSSAFPAGGPSKISVSTTSASSISTIRCAVVDPTNPPPTTVTFFRLIFLSTECRALVRQIFLTSFLLYCAPSCEFRCLLSPSRQPHHILNNCPGKRRRPQFRSTRHQPLQVIGHALLLDGPCDPVFNQLRRVLPTQKLEHHRPAQHHRARVDHVLVRILWRGPVRGFKRSIPVADI